MSKPANKTVIGIFVLGAIALIVIAIVVLGSGKFFRETFTAVCFFEGSVKGLNEGSPVVFRGVKIGSVTGVVLTYDPKDLLIKIPVYVEIDPSLLKPAGPTPVRRARPGENLKLLIDRGLRASLEMQSIVTGQMQVGLDFHPDKPATFVGYEPKYPEIPTIPTPLQELAKKIEKIPIEEIFEKLLAAVEGVEKVVNSPDLKEALRSINLALADVRKLARNMDGQVGPLAANLNDAVQDIRKMVQNADAKVTGLASSLDETVKETRGVIRNVDSRIEPLAASIEGTIKSAEATVKLAQKAIEGIEGTVGEDSTLVYELNKTLEEISTLARSIRALSNYLQRRPESAIWGK